MPVGSGPQGRNILAGCVKKCLLVVKRLMYPFQLESFVLNWLLASGRHEQIMNIVDIPALNCYSL